MNNTIDLVTPEGVVWGEAIHVNKRADLSLFQVGHRADILYALDELKHQPAPDGGVNSGWRWTWPSRSIRLTLIHRRMRRSSNRSPRAPEAAQRQLRSARYNAPCPPTTISDTVRCSPTRNWCAN
ncbi:hypothetical protein [Massilia pseudoviolaceinigra]|uniref:hypothetical protein n=1 Tax=Massilia pseudoviolaceinigra TaxID=3057165 RepID=UPI002796CE12|nr:hypothetical protein [Massilia sp. CCM 9206]MDQ1920069.1 hypothetical protein [Massilia sp. CCM 9206]